MSERVLSEEFIGVVDHSEVCAGFFDGDADGGFVFVQVIYH